MASQLFKASCASYAKGLTLPALCRSCPRKHGISWINSNKIDFCPWNRGFWWTGYKTTGVLRWALDWFRLNGKSRLVNCYWHECRHTNPHSCKWPWQKISCSFASLGDFGAIQAQAVSKIFILMRKSIPLERVWAKSRTSCFSAGRPLKQQRPPARRAL